MVKTILDDDMKVVTITCDVILHSRGGIPERDNLIAVEMKKSNRPEIEKTSDKDRLRALTKTREEVFSYDGRAFPEHVCGYEIGCYLEIDRNNLTYSLEKYIGGELANQLADSYRPITSECM